MAKFMVTNVGIDIKSYAQAKNLCGISSGSTLFPNTKSIFRERKTIFFENYNL